MEGTAAMTATLPDVAAKKKQGPESAEQLAAAELVRQARERGLSLTGPDGLLSVYDLIWRGAYDVTSRGQRGLIMSWHRLR